MSLLDQIFSDSQESAVPTDDALKSIASCVQDQVDAEVAVAAAEKRLEAEKANLHMIRTKTLPDLMLGNRCTRFDLDSGKYVEVTREYFASIKQENLEAAHDWLRRNNHGDLIKNTVEVVVKKGQDELAAQIVKLALELKLNFTRGDSVHSSTLKAFIKGEYEKAIDAGRSPGIPKDLFGIFVLDVTKIKEPKGKTKR